MNHYLWLIYKDAVASPNLCFVVLVPFILAHHCGSIFHRIVLHTTIPFILNRVQLPKRECPDRQSVVVGPSDSGTIKGYFRVNGTLAFKSPFASFHLSPFAPHSLSNASEVLFIALHLAQSILSFQSVPFFPLWWPCFPLVSKNRESISLESGSAPFDGVATYWIRNVKSVLNDAPETVAVTIL